MTRCLCGHPDADHAIGEGICLEIGTMALIGALLGVLWSVWRPR